MHRDDLIWLAGLLEGEGCFTTTTGRKGSRFPVVKVNMTDRDVIDRVAALVDRKPSVHVQAAENRKQAWRVKVVGQPALSLMRDLRPLMGQRRRARIDELLTIFS